MALALWDAALLLSWMGWGSRFWPSSPGALRWAIWGAAVVSVSGYFQVSVGGGVNCGWLALSVLSLLAASWYRLRLFGHSAVLGLLAWAVRVQVPLVALQAGLTAGFWPEVLAMGFAAGIWEGHPFSAAVTAMVAEEAASLLMLWTPHAAHFVGNRDLAVTIVSGLFAWLVGWVLWSLGTRPSRTARGSS